MENIYETNITEQNFNKWFLDFVEILKKDGTTVCGRVTECIDADDTDYGKAMFEIHLSSGMTDIDEVDLDEIAGIRSIPRMWTSPWERKINN